MNKQFVELLRSFPQTLALGLMRVNWAGDTARSYVKACEVLADGGNACSVQLTSTIKGRGKELLTVGHLLEVIDTAVGDTNPEYYFLRDKYTANAVNGVIYNGDMVILTM